MEITGAELFVKALQEEGIKHLFAYPGGHVMKRNEKYAQKVTWILVHNNSFV